MQQASVLYGPYLVCTWAITQRAIDQLLEVCKSFFCPHLLIPSVFGNTATLDVPDRTRKRFCSNWTLLFYFTICLCRRDWCNSFWWCPAVTSKEAIFILAVLKAGMWSTLQSWGTKEIKANKKNNSWGSLDQLKHTGEERPQAWLMRQGCQVTQGYTGEQPRSSFVQKLLPHLLIFWICGPHWRGQF